MEDKYDHKDIEKKWQKKWDSDGIYKTPESVEASTTKASAGQGKNFYQLVEFTYPSGDLHVGHWYAFAVPDIFARFKKMQGYNVLYPMGFDAFGLPAENAAIKFGADPKVWTYEQMEKMRAQFRSMGAMFPWEREVVSCDPEYYKWTQWMFTQFLKNDLVYRASTKVNWCPKDQTILANEQVVNGKCERCESEVTQRDQEQWMIRITKYADRLIDDLETLEWPDAIKESQKNWIGRSEGSEIGFRLEVIGNSEIQDEIKVFTTRADTLFGVTYIVLAPEHPFIEKNILTFTSGVTNKSEIEKYIADTKKKSELDRQQAKEKTGIEVRGIKAINPATGESVPVWIADYVLSSYGTGAVMAVPAHDERDFEFAKKYNLPLRESVRPFVIDHVNVPRADKPSKTRENVHAIVFDPKAEKYLILRNKLHDWDSLVIGGVEDGEDYITTAIREIKEETGYTDVIYKRTLGLPVQAAYFAKHKDENRIAVATALYFELGSDAKIEIPTDGENEGNEILWVPTKDFVPGKMINSELPFWLERMKHTEDLAYIGEGILVNSGEFDGLDSEEARSKITEFVGGKMVKTYRLRDWGISRQRYWGTPIPIVYDPEGNAHPVPDEHLPWLLPTDVDHTPDGTAPLARSKELQERTEKIFGAGWKPEIETMDTFVDSSWYFYRYLDNHNNSQFASMKNMDEWMPIDLYMGGAEHTTMHVLYSRFWTKALHDLGFVKDTEAYKIRRNRGLILGPDGEKMSKSRGNVINPDEIVDRLGADTVRLYLAFMGPYGVTVNYPWDPNGVVGVRRFLERVWKLKSKVGDTNGAKDKTVLEKAIMKITEDMGVYKFNTAISEMMILLNAWEKENSILIDEYKKFLKLLAPFAPHVAEELWYECGEKESVHLSDWPTWDASKILSEEILIIIQINGKMRSQLRVSVNAGEEEITRLAKNDEKAKQWIEGLDIQRTIYVPGKLINFVI